METLNLTINNVWMMICTALVFIMHLGFSLLEIGLTRQKNTINILFKNFFIICSGLLLYALFGFNLMYPGFAENSLGIFNFAGFGIAPPENGMTAAYADGGYTWWTDFLFQGMFAATAATIISGAVAERMKITSFALFALLYISIVYPIVGSWKWGGGFLDSLGFYDFAGSTIVHSVGGWAALVTIIMLGSRLGKFVNGQSKALMGHNLPLSATGVFLLWFGWFGFNGGSVLSADPELVSLTLVTTCLAAASGGVFSTITSFTKYKSLDLTMFMNGILGGLVGVTAGADVLSPGDAVWVGAIAGIIVVFGIELIEKLKLDDPVGAVPVHLICGIWGTLAVGIFGQKAGLDQFFIQLIGVFVVGAFSVLGAFIFLKIIKSTMGIRVTKKEEEEGLDKSEHGGMYAYPDFRLKGQSHS